MGDLLPIKSIELLEAGFTQIVLNRSPVLEGNLTIVDNLLALTFESQHRL